MSLPPWWPANLIDICDAPNKFYELCCLETNSPITFERFKEMCINDAVCAIRQHGKFYQKFINHVGVPGYAPNEWEEDIIYKLLALSSSG